jgi:hypothetical protein
LELGTFGRFKGKGRGEGGMNMDEVLHIHV